MLCLQVLFGDEFLHGIYGDCLVYGATGAGVLATSVTDSSADCREWVLAFNQLQSLSVLAFGSLFQIALHGDMGRTGCLARGGTARIAVDAVSVAIVFVPHMTAPLGGVWQHLAWILLLAALGAEFLAQFHGSGRAILHATTTGDTIGLLHLSDIGAAGHIRRVKELGCTQSVANLYVTVTDGEYLALSVDVGDLMHIAIVLGPAEYLHSLLVANVAASSGLAAVIRHIAHSYAPVVIVVGAALVEFLSTVTAGANGGADVSFVFFEPIRNVLYIKCLVLH